LESMLFEDKKEAPVYNPDDPKVGREVHLLMGLLRFVPDKDGVFTARCAPDNYILPALKPYFTARFKEIPWSIIDEKRSLCLRKRPGEKAEILEWTETHEQQAVSANTVPGAAKDDYEELWKHYHKTINNEDRDNPNLQRQFMPKRYWKYLSEVSSDE